MKRIFLFVILTTNLIFCDPPLTYSKVIINTVRDSTSTTDDTVDSLSIRRRITFYEITLLSTKTVEGVLSIQTDVRIVGRYYHENLQVVDGGIHRYIVTRVAGEDHDRIQVNVHERNPETDIPSDEILRNFYRMVDPEQGVVQEPKRFFLDGLETLRRDSDGMVSYYSPDFQRVIRSEFISESRRGSTTSKTEIYLSVSPDELLRYFEKIKNGR